MPNTVISVKILDEAGKPMQLRTKLGEGGEGSVWASPSDTSRAVKIYLNPIAQAKTEKLRAMAAMTDRALVAAAAWPLRVVYDARNIPVGFEMPKLTAQKPLHEIFGTKSRIKAFPHANWQMMLHAAVNLATAFERLHAGGIVVGDVNSNNVVISDDARVLFIDCDSFQIRSATRLFRCEVGVPEYQPPELQGVAFDSIDRQPSADAFGMAVMIFQLLFVGKHPFMGRGNSPPTIGENITQGNYFYDETAARSGLKPPRASLTLGAVTPVVAQLFGRAFRGQPTDRPTATEWRGALTELERSIIACSVVAAHRYRKGTSCPWCAIELQPPHIVYFAAPILISTTGVVDDSIWATFSDSEVERIWAEITKIAPPNTQFMSLEKNPMTPASIGKTARKRGFVFLGMMAGFVVAGIALWFIPKLQIFDLFDAIVLSTTWLFGRPSGGPELAGRRQRKANAQTTFDAAEAEWQKICDPTEYSRHRSRLQGLRTTLLEQKRSYDSELARVQQTGREKAQNNYLDSQFISHAKIKGIGKALSARLELAGIETALDVDDRVRMVSGIGEAKARALIDWRESITRSFRFEPTMIEGMLREVKLKFAQQRAQARAAYCSGPEALRQIVQRAESQAPPARAKAIVARAELDQAIADMRPFPPLIYR